MINKQQLTLDYWLNIVTKQRERLSFKDYSSQEVDQSSLEIELSEALVKKLAKATKGSVYAEFIISLAGLFSLLNYYKRAPWLITTPDFVYDKLPAEKNTPLFFHLDQLNAESFKELVEKVKSDFSRAINHKSYDFGKLDQLLQRNSPEKQEELYEIGFAHHALGHADFDQASRFGLWFCFIRDQERASMKLYFDKHSYSSDFAHRMVAHFLSILDLMLSDSSLVVTSLLPLSEDEIATQLVHFNPSSEQTSPFPVIDELLEQQAELTPDGIAIKGEEQEISYAQLISQTRKVAYYLRNHGHIEKGKRVGILLDPSPEMIYSIFGILKAGAAYVPLDPTLPEERLQYIVDDTGIDLIITTTEHMFSLNSIFKGDLFAIDLQLEDITITEEIQFSESKPDDEAYVMYTSGSTGKPRGISVLQKGVVRLVRDTNYVSIGQGDNILQLSNYAFDGSVFDIFGALLNGACLHFAGRAATLSMQQLAQVINERNINVAFITTALFNAMVDTQISCIGHFDKLFFGGEEASLKHARKALNYQKRPGALVHVYGPTESTTFATYYKIFEIPHNDTRLPIGQPIARTTAYILNDDMLPLPAYVPGKIFLGGKGLAAGYLGNDELNRQKFVTVNNAFFSGIRLYDTGDMGRQRPDGMIEFLGRQDGQLKIRGHRIEIGEIENALLRHEEIKETKVIVETGESNDKYLVAYFTAHDKKHPQELKPFLGEILPAYMLPFDFRQVDQIPLNQNGKADVRKLKELIVLNESNEQSGQHVAPTSVLEKEVINIWQEQLGVDGLGIEDNFFTLGGDSIKAIRVISQMNDKLGLYLEIKDIFTHQDIKTLCELISKQGVTLNNEKNKAHGYVDALRKEIESTPSLTKYLPENYEDVYPMSDIQKGMIYYNALNEDSIVYQVQMFNQIKLETFDEMVLRHAFKLLVKKHSILRTCFDLTHFTVPMQIVLEEVDLNSKIQVEDISKLGEHDQKEYIEQLQQKDLKQKFSLNDHGLWRIYVFKLSEQEYGLLFSFHHAILDGWSDASLLAELNDLYIKLLESPNYSPPMLATTYKDYVVDQLSIKGDSETESFWTNVLEGHQRLPLPLAKHVDSTQFKGQKEGYYFRLDPSIVSKVDAYTDQYKLSKQDVYYAAFLVFLYQTTNQNDLLIGRVTHNRPATVDGDKVLGCFLNSIPNRHILPSEATYEELIRETSNAMVSQKQFEKFPFMEIVRLLGESEAYNPFFDITFGFLEFHIYETIQNPVEEKQAMISGVGSTNTFFDFILEKEGEDVFMVINTVEGLYSNEEFNRMKRYYNNILAQMLENPRHPYSINDAFPSVEKHYLLHELNDTSTTLPDNYNNVLDIVAEITRSQPQAIAIQVRGQSITYKQLEEQYEGIASRLRNHYGIDKGDKVGLRLKRPENALPFILGMMKIGGVYVPLNVGDPQSRIETIASEASLKLLITDFEDDITNTAIWDYIRNPSPAEFHKVDTTSCYRQDEAYVIYTSGTTGVPKGVVGSHGNLLYMALYQKELLGLGFGKKVLQFANLTFDASLLEIFPTISSGSTLVVPSSEEKDNPEILSGFIAKTNPHLAVLPPALLPLIDRSALFKIGTLITGGESPTADQVNAIAENITYFNGYGVTESTVISTAFHAEEQIGLEQRVPIGKPLGNQQIYVLSDRLELIPQGIPGEICISGDGLALGYLNDAELTRLKFVEHPFRKGEKLYRTGDQGFLDGKGNLVFLGRKDDQVKVRGYRIELGEVEKAIHQHQSVVQCAVLVTASEFGNSLSAYVVVNQDFDQKVMMKHAASILPPYMIPTHWVVLDELPLNKNGKVDQKALKTLSHPSETRSEAFQAPTNDLEVQLVNIWSEILQLTVDEISIDRSFFELGGHSLSAMVLMNKISGTFGVDVPMVDLLGASSISEMAQKIARGAHLSPSIEFVIPLKKQDFSNENLFFIHDGSGDIQGYTKLVSGVQHYDCWGVRSDHFNDIAPGFDSVENMASRYLQQIRKIQPHGPYHFAGWSMGGLIAMEMVHQLEQNNEIVDTLFMIDTSFPDVTGVDPSLENDSLLLIELGVDVGGAGAINSLEALWQHALNFLTANERVRDTFITTASKVYGDLLPNINDLSVQQLVNNINTIRTLSHAIERYRPSFRLNSRMTFVKALQSDFEVETMDRYFNHPMVVIEMEGNHYSIMEGPVVNKLSKMIDSEIAVAVV